MPYFHALSQIRSYPLKYANPYVQRPFEYFVSFELTGYFVLYILTRDFRPNRNICDKAPNDQAR